MSDVDDEEAVDVGDGEDVDGDDVGEDDGDEDDDDDELPPFNLF